MKNVNFVSLRHNHAPKDGDGHIWLPSSETTVMALLKEKGINVHWTNENLKKFAPESGQTIAISLVGAPYIPEAIRFIKRIVNEVGNSVNFVIGGQVVEHLHNEEFTALFGEHAKKGNQFLQENGINPGDEQKVSLKPIYEMIDDADMKKYLNQTFSLYLSQGCKYACKFCAAVRTKGGKKVVEQYRDINTVQTDLSYLVDRAKSLDINKLKIYISNLDAFQTLKKLSEFTESVEEILQKNPKFEFDFRCLVTVDATIKLCEKHPDLAKRLVNIGFTNIGIGIDGMTPAVWKGIGKGHNFNGKNDDGNKYEDGEKTMKSIELAHEYGFRPEALMVFGHAGVDDADSMQLALDFTKDVVKKFNAVPRPHVSKHFVPGNTAWDDPKNKHLRKLLIKNPDVFQALDFTAEASPFTHPDEAFRKVVNKYYAALCDLESSITPRVKSIEHSFNGKTIEVAPNALQKVKESNIGQYDV